MTIETPEIDTLVPDDEMPDAEPVEYVEPDIEPTYVFEAGPKPPKRLKRSTAEIMRSRRS